MLNKVPQTSRALIERATDESETGRRQALNELVAIYSPYIYSVVLRHIPDPNDAQDVAQEFIANNFLSGAVTRNYNPKTGRFRTYLFAAVRNACRQHFRQTSDSVSYDSKLYGPTEMHARDDTPLNEDVVWAQTLLAAAVCETRERLLAGNKPEIWELYLDQVIRPVLFRVTATPMNNLTKTYGLTEQQIRGKIQNGKRSLIKGITTIVGTLDDQVLISGSRTDEIFELLTSPGAFDGMEPTIFEKFGLDEISEAIFLSRSPLASLVKLDEAAADDASDCSAWKKLMGTPLSQLVKSHTRFDTVGNVLFQPTNPKETLTLLRHFSKVCIGDQTNAIEVRQRVPPEVAKHLYCVAIAAGIVHHREKSSSLDSTQLLFNLEKIKESKLMSQASRNLVTDAIRIMKTWN